MEELGTGQLVGTRPGWLALDTVHPTESWLLTLQCSDYR
jgi:hypothetical protein